MAKNGYRGGYCSVKAVLKQTRDSLAVTLVLIELGYVLYSIGSVYKIFVL